MEFELISKRFACYCSDNGIKELRPFQKTGIDEALEDKNLVIHAPTGSGKTLIAYARLFNAYDIIENTEKQIIYCVPLKSIAEEKYDELRQYISSLSLITGSVFKRVDPKLLKSNVIITTYEKCDSMLNHNELDPRDIALTIIDEYHVIETERGVAIEDITARVAGHSQIILMSATIPNAKEIANYLELIDKDRGASLIEETKRPVPLYKGVFISDKKVKTPKVVAYCGSDVITMGSYNDVIKFICDTMTGLSFQYGGLTRVSRFKSIVFVSSRKKAEDLAKKIRDVLKKTGKIRPHDDEFVKENVKGIDKLYRDDIASLVKWRVCYHHAGLHESDRHKIEWMFRRQEPAVIDTIVSTTTLAAGVNLPADIVIVNDIFRFNTERFKMMLMTPTEIHQMLGRAGRPGISRFGVGLLNVKSVRHLEKARTLLLSPPSNIISILKSSKRAFYKTVLTLLDIELIRKTLWFNQVGTGAITDIRDAIDQLLQWGMITEHDGEYIRTDLGEKTLLMYVNPETAYILDRNAEMIDESNPFQTFVLFASTPDVQPPYIPRQSTTVTYERSDTKTVAQIMDEWINETPEKTIIETFRIYPADLRMLIEQFEWIAAAASAITGKVSEILIGRIHHGVKEELLDLVKIKNIGRVRARVLYDAGFETVEQIANARPEDIASILNCTPKFAKSIITSAKNLIKRGVV